MMALVVFGGCFLAFSLFNPAHGQNYSMPKELVEYAKANGCNEVTGFFDRPGMVKPPYMYGYLPGPEENSAVFWCEKGMSGRRSFLLIFISKNKNEGQLKCPGKIEWHNFPGGLSIHKNGNETLEGFRYLKDPLKKPPENVQLIGNSILSEYDGVETLFYCYKGEWVVRMED